MAAEAFRCWVWQRAKPSCFPNIIKTHAKKKLVENTSFSDIVDLRLQGLRLCIMESKESCVFCNTECEKHAVVYHFVL